MCADYTQEIPERFRIHYDGGSGVFRILDLWAEDVKNLPPDAAIPDNSPALKTLSTLEINALLGKLKQMGWIDKMFGQGEQTTSIYPKKDIKEIAIENIEKIVELSADQGVTKEAILSIKEIVNNLGNNGEFEVKLDYSKDKIRDVDVKGNPELDNIIPIKRGPGRPRKEK